jgi:type IV pilus assembly protein PilV
MKYPTRATSVGFTVIEVMVALVVIAVGLLGVAKMQGMALATTGTSRLRSLAAIEAASLASAMHANRAYWAATILTTPIQVSGNTATTSDANLTAALATVNSAGTDYCTTSAGAPCTPVTLAATDLQDWANDLKAMLPNSSATISCPSTSTPLSCTIQISWSENAVAVNRQGTNATGTSAFQVPTYKVYVQP